MHSIAITSALHNVHLKMFNTVLALDDKEQLAVDYTKN